MPLVLLALGQLPLRANALKDDKSVWSFSTSDTYSKLAEFGFDHGGSYSLEMELTKVESFTSVASFFARYNGSDVRAPGVWVAACRDDELDSTGRFQAVCTQYSGTSLAPPCSRSYRFSGARLSVADRGVSGKQYLTFIVVACGFDSADVRGNVAYELRMSDGGHLGYDLAPLPLVYAALVVLWAIVMSLWVGNLVKFRQQNVILQRALTVVPGAKLLGVFFRAYYYGQGHLSGDLPQAALYFYYIVYIMYKGFFYTALLLISKGWLITRPSLEEGEKRTLFLVVTAFCALVVLYAFSSWLNSAYSLLMLIGIHFYICA
jgi:hypothetical protein